MEGGAYSLVPPLPSSDGTRAQESMCSRGEELPYIKFLIL